MPQDEEQHVAEEATTHTSHANIRRTRRAALFAISTVVVLSAAVGALLWSRNTGSSSSAKKLADRQAEVERRGQSVMPFDQNKTMHQFRDTTSGGVETVTANDPHDQEQISLIRQHLTRERDLFAAGNFTDPMAIHGMTMPGIQGLQRAAAAGRVSITYAALANGASLTYSASDTDLIDTLHTWFDAQLMDHGSHATG